MFDLFTFCSGHPGVCLEVQGFIEEAQVGEMLYAMIWGRGMLHLSVKGACRFQSRMAGHSKVYNYTGR